MKKLQHHGNQAVANIALPLINALAGRCPATYTRILSEMAALSGVFAALDTVRSVLSPESLDRAPELTFIPAPPQDYRWTTNIETCATWYIQQATEYIRDVAESRPTVWSDRERMREMFIDPIYDAINHYRKVFGQNGIISVRATARASHQNGMNLSFDVDTRQFALHLAMNSNDAATATWGSRVASSEIFTSTPVSDYVAYVNSQQ